MLIAIIFTNLLWFLITSYLIWHITGRPVITMPWSKKDDRQEIVPEASDADILSVMKSKQEYDLSGRTADKYDAQGIPEVEENEVE